MSELLATILPEQISPIFAAVLVVASFIASALTAMVGIGGGMIMLVTMASVLPIATVVPVHGVIQLGSNFGRAVVLRKSIDLTIAAPFTIGCLVGALIGVNFVVALPDAVLRIVLAFLILWTVWRRIPMPKRGSILVALGVSTVSAFLATIMGATGPIVVSLLRAMGLDHIRLVATSAAAMTLQHSLKIAAFGFLGFTFAPWLPLIAILVAVGFMGTLVGARVVLGMEVKTFQKLFRIVMTIMAAEMFRRGISDLIWP